MKPSKRIWVRIAKWTGFLLLALCVLEIWHKHDFCQGLADHYSARAEQLRAEAVNPALGSKEKRELLIAADWHDIIAHKYVVVARQPWRSYPRYPLITQEEQQIAAAKH